MHLYLFFKCIMKRYDKIYIVLKSCLFVKEQSNPKQNQTTKKYSNSVVCFLVEYMDRDYPRDYIFTDEYIVYN